MTQPVNQNTITDRAKTLFKALVERYIRDGEPVGSKTLALDAGNQLSPATIRNVLADLEAQGFLRAPHTSAGRIPTDKGYRLFVDSLLTIKPISHSEVKKVEKELHPEMEASRLMKKASSLISQITSLAGLVTLPKQKQTVLTHIEFIALSDNRLLVVLVTNEREIQNRIIHTHKEFSKTELYDVNQYLNQHFIGKELSYLKQELKSRMKADKDNITALLHSAMEIAPEQNDFVMSGEAHLLNIPPTNRIQDLQKLFDAFAQKHDILHLLDRCLEAEGIQLFIGEESRYKPFDDCSLITSPYQVDGQTVGVLAVIGPTRMAYDRIIPIVDITAKLLTAALNKEN